MGSKDYKIDTLPVGPITRKYGLSFHGYADDSNNHIAFSLSNPVSYENALFKIANSTAEIKRWKCQIMLKLNDTKTEVLVIVPPKHKDSLGQSSVQITDASIRPSESAKGLGVRFDWLRFQNCPSETERRTKDKFWLNVSHYTKVLLDTIDKKNRFNDKEVIFHKSW